MDGFQVMPVAEAARVGDLFVTATGDVNVLRPEHVALHEGRRDPRQRRPLQRRDRRSRPRGDGRLVPRGAARACRSTRCPTGAASTCSPRAASSTWPSAEGHPASVMDMSFANQALCVEFLAREGAGLEPRVYAVPRRIDDEIAALKLARSASRSTRSPTSRRATSPPGTRAREPGRRSEIVRALTGDGVRDARPDPPARRGGRCSSARPGRRWSTPSARSRSAARRRSAIAGAMGVALAAARADPADLDGMRDRDRHGRRRPARRPGRPPSTSPGPSTPRSAWPRRTPARPRTLAAALAAAARALHADEVARCEAIGAHGAALLTRRRARHDHLQRRRPRDGRLRHGAGRRARPAYAADPTLRVVVPETRPLLQGARLTAWELARDGIPHTLITDAMAGRDDGRRRRRRTWSWAPTASPPTATSRTRSAPTAWPCWRASTASRSSWPRPPRRSTARPRRRAHPHRGARGGRGARARPLRPPRRAGGLAGGQPGLRRHAGPPRRRHRDRERGAPAALRALAVARGGGLRRGSGLIRDGPARDAGRVGIAALLDVILPPACAGCGLPGGPACDGVPRRPGAPAAAVVRGLRRAGAPARRPLPGLSRAHRRRAPGRRVVRPRAGARGRPQGRPPPHARPGARAA